MSKAWDGLWAKETNAMKLQIKPKEDLKQCTMQLTLQTTTPAEADINFYSVCSECCGWEFELLEQRHVTSASSVTATSELGRVVQMTDMCRSRFCPRALRSEM